MAYDNTTNWISKEKRAQFNTNCNGLKINTEGLALDVVYSLAQAQVDKGFELYPDKEDKGGIKAEEVI